MLGLDALDPHVRRELRAGDDDGLVSLNPSKAKNDFAASTSLTATVT